jgi:hypothetical protein
MADPTFAELGTLSYQGSNAVTSLSTTIQNVSVGDLLIVVVQRNDQDACTGVASTSPALTFTKLAAAVYGIVGFDTELWGAIATSSASSQVITASYSNSDSWGAMFSARYTGGVSSITPNATTAHAVLQSSSTNRTNANMTTTVRTLMIAFGTNWDNYDLISAAANWNLRVNADTFGNNTTTQFLLDRVADAGTYPSGNYGTNDYADQYVSGIVALPVTVGGATALPRRALDGPFYGSLQGSVR